MALEELVKVLRFLALTQNKHSLLQISSTDGEKATGKQTELLKQWGLCLLYFSVFQPFSRKIFLFGAMQAQSLI